MGQGQNTSPATLANTGREAHFIILSFIKLNLSAGRIVLYVTKVR